MDHGSRIYINGSLSGQLDIASKIDPALDVDLLIGMNREKVAPSHPVRTYDRSRLHVFPCSHY